MGVNVKPGEYYEQKHERDREVHEAGQYRGERKQDTREIDLGQQLVLVHQAVACLGQGVGEVGPRVSAASANTSYGSPSDPSRAKPAEDYGEVEDRHREERLKHGPRRAEQSLLVAELEIAKHEEVQQLVRAGEFAQVERRPPLRRPNRGDRRRGGRGMPLT